MMEIRRGLQYRAFDRLGAQPIRSCHRLSLQLGKLPYLHRSDVTVKHCYNHTIAVHITTSSYLVRHLIDEQCLSANTLVAIHSGTSRHGFRYGSAPALSAQWLNLFLAV